ncbi:uncharacterized protein LOC115440296 [Manduca sexta]|uniref:uncharacterized protein LOC115440296 n=1 Tax=Manduca sexta TaxID=7130 RepID=UPI00188FD4D6|nr:uncharacterized protein LOC115440296 [Manduca sexta]
MPASQRTTTTDRQPLQTFGSSNTDFNMRGAGGLLALAVATLLVCCSADPHQEQDVSAGEHNSGERFDVNELRQREELENFLRFLTQYENKYDDHGSLRNLNGIGGTSLIGRNLNGIGGTSLLGRNLNGIGGSSLLGRSLYSSQGRSGISYKNLNGIGGTSLLGRNLNVEYARFIDSLGGGNFVRNLDSLGGSNFVRNLDSLGGANLVKKNLDQLGGPNLVKRNLDSLGGSHKIRSLDPLGGNNLVRDVREVKHSAYFPYMFRRYDYISPYGKREPWPMAPVEYSGYYGDGFPKRNFDEIDRSSLNTFVKKRNFDEIDRSSMPFPYATKRFYHLYGSNYLDIDTPVSSLDKKRYRPDYPMDEIDLSHFPIGSKRSQDSYPLTV